MVNSDLIALVNGAVSIITTPSTELKDSVAMVPFMTFSISLLEHCFSSIGIVELSKKILCLQDHLPKLKK